MVLNTAAFPMPADKKLPFALWLGGRTALGAALIRGFNAFSGLAARIAFKKPVSEEVRAGYTGPYDSWDNRIATLRFVQDIPLRKPGDRGYDIVASTAENLHRFADKPVLLAWGLQDFVFDETFLPAMAALPARGRSCYRHCRLWPLRAGGRRPAPCSTGFDAASVAPGPATGPGAP